MNTNERLCRPVRVGELIEPLMKIISHPDRNNLIRDFFAAEDERRKAEVLQPCKRHDHIRKLALSQ